MDNCYSKYIKFECAKKKQADFLCSSNSIVGDEFGIINNKIFNKFGQEIGTTNKQDAREITILENKDFDVHIYLSYVGFDEEKGHFGEVLVLAHDKKLAGFENFCKKIQSRIAEGNRPVIELDKFNVNKIADTNGKWQPKELMPKPELEENSALVKTKMTFIEKLIEAARDKNPGCYLGTVFIMMLIAAFIFYLVSKIFCF